MRGYHDLTPASAEKSISTTPEALGQKPSVSCPDEIKAEKDGTFTCTVTASDGAKATIKATQTDDNGHFNFSIS